MKGKVITSTIAVIVLLLAAIAFIWMPTMGFSTGTKNLASWDGVPITTGANSPYFSKLEQIKRLFESFGGTVPDDEYSQRMFGYNLSNTAMSASIIDLAMETEVEKNGYAPSKKLVNRTLIRQFTDPATGQYSAESYEKTSDAVKLQMRNDVVANLKRSRYVQDVVGYSGSYGLKTSSKETKFISDMATEKRAIEYVEFQPINYPLDKIKEYAESHADLFVKYDLSIVSFQTENAASTVAKSISSGEVSFDDALKNQDASVTNSNVDSDGKLINCYRKDLNALFPNAEDLNKVINLKAGDVSKPVKMNALYVVLKCNSDPVQPNFDDAMLTSQVAYYLRQYEKGMVEDYLMERAGKFSKAATEKGMVDASVEFGVKPTTAEPFAINYGNSRFLAPLPSTDPMVSRAASNNEEFFKSVFSLKEGEFSKPFLANENAVVVMLKSITPKDTSDTNMGNNYKMQNQNWTEYYTLSLLTNQLPLGLAQSTVINYIITNPKAKNDLYKYIQP